MRHQVAGGFIVTLLPFILLLSWSDTATTSFNVVIATWLYSVVAMLVGIMLLRSVSQYPGVEASAYVLPSFGISYGLMLMALIFVRLSYSRILLLISFMSIIVWFIAVHVIVVRRRSLEIGIVPGGDCEALLLPLTGVRWTVLDDPEQDISGLHAITADLRVDLPSEWDRKLADYALQGMPVYHGKHLAESITGMVQLEHISENSFGTLSPVSAFMTAKHIGDWIAAACALVLLFPALVLIAILIRLDSSGSPIFRQIRIGYRGVPFTVYKFRTMVSGERAGGALDAAKTKSADARITRIGRFLRKSRIDELPQILNILKGEMSWIGPRPEARVLSEWYEGEIPFYRYRHIVRPGLTGWAQVNQGHVAEVEDVREKLYFDFYYIKNFSPWIDCLIVAKTAQTMLTGFGAK
ncbi:sugar transferase [Sphingomonas hankookensis]|uniref:sugar transferase n=1 Tax=Sphingomonas hankookensis TaxID=563996 RepID=UPI0018DE447B|nr:sugar transferase [Sphingomonas hankookensis]